MTIPETHRPLDARINEGILLLPGLVHTQIHSLGERVARAFISMHRDSSREFGTGLAFGFRLPDDEILLVEHQLLQLGIEHYAGNNLKASPTETGVNFAGTFQQKEFFISSRVGAIALSSGEVEQSSYILSLHAKFAQPLKPQNHFGAVGGKITNAFDKKYLT